MWPGAELNLFLFFSVTVLAVAEHLSMVWFRYIWITRRLVQFLPAQSSDKGKYRFLSIGEMIKAHHHLLQFQLLDTKEPENIDCPWYEPALSVWSLSLYKKFLKDIIAARWQLLSLSQGANKPWPEAMPTDSSASATVLQKWHPNLRQNRAASSTKRQLKTLLTF